MSLKDTPPKKAAVNCKKKKKKTAKMTVETVETVVAAAPYSALIGHKLRSLLSDSQSALADCEEEVIQICHLLSRNGKLCLVRLTKSFPTIPNLRGIANAYQNDERFKMWSVMLLCTISGYPCKIYTAKKKKKHVQRTKKNGELDKNSATCI